MTPLRMPELLGALAWGWGPEAVATVTTLQDYPDPVVAIEVTDDRGVVLDLVLDPAAMTVDGSCRWDEAHVVWDQVYQPCDQSPSGWDLYLTHTGVMDAVADGVLLYGPSMPDMPPTADDIPPRPRVRGLRRPTTQETASS